MTKEKVCPCEEAFADLLKYIKEEKMNQLNSLIIEGNVSGNVTSIPGNPFVSTFVIETRRVFNCNGEEIEERSFFDVEAWGNIGRFVFDRLKDGNGLRLVGRLKQKVWKDADDRTYSKTVIIAEHIEVQKMGN